MSTATAVATKQQPSAFELELATYEPQIAAALPAHIPIDRFKRVVITAINQNPALYRADRRSLFISCVRAAQDGLLPDGREAALVTFKMKDRQTGAMRDVVQYMPMVAGIIKRMRNSGEVAAVITHVVYENDEFEYELGDSERIVHKPTLKEPGEPIAAYAIIKLTNGEILREVMSRAQIERVRAVSRAKDNGPWVEWWDEMARKTVLRRCAKRAPVSSDLDELLKRDDEAFFGSKDRPQATVMMPANEPDEPETTSKLDRFEQDDVTVDATASEVADAATPAPEAPAEPAPINPWLISAEAFKTQMARVKELQRQLNEVVASPADVDALMNANAKWFMEVGEPTRKAVEKLAEQRKEALARG